MSEREIEFREPDLVTARSLGEPGQRTFYLIAVEGSRWVKIWVEKEHLLLLSAAMARILAALGESFESRSREGLDQGPEEPAGTPSLEFRLEGISMGYDAGRDLAGIILSSAEDPDVGEKLDFTCWVTRQQVREIKERVDQVCAAGRPLCRLCAAPIDPEGHTCPRSNGHLLL